MNMAQNIKGKGMKATTTERQTKETSAADNMTSSEQPSWVAALKASIKTSLDAMQAKINVNQQIMDSKLDRMSTQMEENLKGVKEKNGTNEGTNKQNWQRDEGRAGELESRQDGYQNT